MEKMEKSDPDQKRLFFGMEVHAPWPKELPDACTLKAKHRHLTLAFLGDTSYSQIKTLIPKLPRPSFRIGPVGIFDSCLFLPRRDPKVVTWHVEPFGENDFVAEYQESLASFLEQQGYELDHREFLKHVTLGRSPFLPKQWKKAFHPLPLYFQNLHLYESHSGLCYEPIWTHDLLPPFKEIEHVADIAFHIYGGDLQQIYCNAQIALAFECPEILPFLKSQLRVENLEEIIIQLNEAVTQADHEVGMPFKAVSFHGEVEKKGENLVWEMIVDV
jgi:RNA 2',3'-cyclic 3'-phosphodiesterase